VAENESVELEGGMGASWPPPGGESSPQPAAPAPQPAQPTAAKPQPEAKPEQKEVVVEERPAPQAQRQEQYEGEPYKLSWPEYMPISEQTPERQALLDSFATMAPEAGLPAAFAQGAFEAYLDVTTAIPYSMDIAYATPEDGQAEMVKLFGQEAAENLIDRANRFTKQSSALSDWLESSGLGNDPAVITTLALAQRGHLGASPAQAKERIESLMNDPKSAYHSTDKQQRLLAIAEIQILSRIAHREGGPEEKLNAAASGQTKFVSPRASNEAAIAETKAKSATEARREIAKMMTEKGGPLVSSGHPKHREAVQRYHELLKLLP